MAKAQAAEQKAQLARDDAARTLAWREAARLWDRAADRETSEARTREYADRAQAARDMADNRASPDEPGEPDEPDEPTTIERSLARSPDPDAPPHEPAGAAQGDEAEAETAPASGPTRWLN